MSPREVREFVEKLRVPERPDYRLDLSRMKTADEMAAASSAAVPVTTVAPSAG